MIILKKNIGHKIRYINNENYETMYSDLYQVKKEILLNCERYIEITLTLSFGGLGMNHIVNIPINYAKKNNIILDIAFSDLIKRGFYNHKVIYTDWYKKC